MVLGQSLWRTEFGGRADVIGTRVKVDGAETTIVGVLPDGFDFPAGSANAWVPLTLDPANGPCNTVSERHREAQAGRVNGAGSGRDEWPGHWPGDAYPDTNAGKSVELFGLKEQINGDAPSLIVILGAAIAAVLLIACLNVASLLTVRTSMRGSELAVRTALGATRPQAAAPAHGGAPPARRRRRRPCHSPGPGVAPRDRRAAAPEPAANGDRVWMGAGGRACRARVADRRRPRADRDSPHVASSASSTLMGSVRQTSTRGVVRLRQGLVIAEVAATLMLLVTAGLMLESARRLSSVDPGFRTETS